MKNLSLIGTVFMVLGSIANLAKGFVDDKKQEQLIEEKVNKALKKEKKGEEKGS